MNGVEIRRKRQGKQLLLSLPEVAPATLRALKTKFTETGRTDAIATGITRLLIVI